MWPPDPVKVAAAACAHGCPQTPSPGCRGGTARAWRPRCRSTPADGHTDPVFPRADRAWKAADRAWMPVDRVRTAADRAAAADLPPKPSSRGDSRPRRHASPTAWRQVRAGVRRPPPPPPLAGVAGRPRRRGLDNGGDARGGVVGEETNREEASEEEARAGRSRAGRSGRRDWGGGNAGEEARRRRCRCCRSRGPAAARSQDAL
nr:unnamed protein product [Digitaria exilis]